MKAVMRNKIVPQLTFDCILYQVEDKLNSRPLTQVPSSPEDDFPLCPNMLVKLHPGYEFLSDTANLPHPGREDWWFKNAQKFSNQIWTRWCKEYLPKIAHYTDKVDKNKGKRDIRVGDYVIYCDPLCHPQNWPRGIVIETYAGRDGLARVADIKLKNGKIVLKRSAYRLARLAIDDSDFNPGNSDLKVSATINALQLACDEFLNERRERYAVALNTLTNSSIAPFFKTFSLEQTFKLPRAQVFSTIYLVYLWKMSIPVYKKIPFNIASEILRGISREPLVPSSLLANGPKSSLVKNIITTADEYNLKEDAKTLKLSSEGLMVSIADLIISFASLGIEPLWIHAADQSRRAPTIIFVRIATEEGADLILRLGRIKILPGDLNVSLPLNETKKFSINQKGFEHALVQFKIDTNTKWKILISRCENLDEEEALTHTHNPLVPRAAPMLGLIWRKRYFSSFEESEFEQLNEGRWLDFRVEQLRFPTLEIPDEEITPEGDMLRELGNNTRFITATNNTIQVRILATQILAPGNNVVSTYIPAIDLPIEASVAQTPATQAIQAREPTLDEAMRDLANVLATTEESSGPAPPQEQVAPATTASNRAMSPLTTAFRNLYTERRPKQKRLMNPFSRPASTRSSLSSRATASTSSALRVMPRPIKEEPMEHEGIDLGAEESLMDLED
jgi:hypothetical protein